MTRNLDAAFLTNVALASAETVKLLEMDFSGGTLYVCNGAADILWNGNTWQALGGNISIEGFAESTDPGTVGNRLQLSGVSQEVIALILGQNYRGRNAKVWLLRLDRSSGIVLSSVKMFDGLINEGFQINESRNFQGGTCSIATKLVVRINDFTKFCGIRTNVLSHQNSGFPTASTDTFFQLVPGLVNRRIRWGSKDPAPHHKSTPVNYDPGTDRPGGSTGATESKPNPRAGGGLINPGGYPWGSNPSGPGWGTTPTDSTSGPGGGAPTMDPGRT